MNMAHYWAAVKEMAADLPDQVHVVILADGTRTERTDFLAREIAARLLVDGAARVASSEEVISYAERERRRQQFAEAIERVTSSQPIRVKIQKQEKPE